MRTATAVATITTCAAMLCLNAADSKPIEIEVRGNAASPDWTFYREPDGSMRKVDAPPFSNVVRLDRIAALLDGHEVRRIVVVRYARSRFASPDAVRAELQALWKTEVDQPLQHIPWSEPTVWSIECRIELKNGSSAGLFTDGWRSCYRDTKGYRWFFRGTVAEAEKRHKH
jgi:hypothetical protein